MSRWVVADDSATDSGITYTGPWFQDIGSLNNIGTIGAPLLNTLHGTNFSASFSYSFNGTMVRIYGTNQWNVSSGVTNPSWQCIVDGVNVPPQLLNTTSPDNGLLYCDGGELADGAHVITLNASVANQQTFWFDYIEYVPTTIPVDQAPLLVYPGDSQFQYGAGWGPILFPGGNLTGQNGSTFSFQFSGASLTWFGLYELPLPLAPTTATYAIDGQSPITFELNGEAANPVGQLNQIFFQTGQLSSSLHTLDVVYQGNNTTAPLTLSHLFIENHGFSLSSSPGATPNNTPPTTSSLPLSSGTPNSAPSSPSNSTSNPSGPSHHSSNLGPIIGGVIGGLALIFVIIAILLFLRRRKKDPSEEADVVVKPFNNPSMAVLSPLTLNVYQNTNDTSSLSPLPLISNRSASPTISMVQVGDQIPLSIHGLMRQRKEQENISRPPSPRSQQSPSSTVGQSRRFIHEEDAGIPLSWINEQGEVVEVLPPVYSF